MSTTVMNSEAQAIEIDCSDPFKYTALADETSKRLLRVQSQKLNGRIQVDTWEANSTDDTPYRCLSYTWGDPGIANTILLNGRPMEVRSNLSDFLEMVVQRLSTDPLWLEAIWIDALCINQNDDAEKSTHVQHMGSIYEHADEVLVWLGTSSTIISLFEWLNKPQPIRDKIAFFIPWDRTPKRLRDAQSELGEHPYWTRAWILQEIHLARHVRLLCGTSEIAPDALSRCVMETHQAFAVDLAHQGRHQLALRYMVLHYELKQVFSLVPMRVRVIEIIVGLLRGAGQNVRKQPFWQTFRTEAVTSKCFDPRDRIYSLLAITGHDTSDSAFRVDYSESNIDTFRRSADHFLAWHQPGKIFELWTALELPGDNPQTIIEELSNKAPISIPMRSNALTTGHKNGVRCAAIDTPLQKEAIVEGITGKDLLLCPSQNDYFDQDANNVHALVRPIGSPNCEALAISLQIQQPHRYPCLEHIELWHTDNGVETRLTSWSSVVNAAETCGKDKFWKEKPHFLLKTTLQYLEELFKIAPRWKSPQWQNPEGMDESGGSSPNFTKVPQD